MATKEEIFSKLTTCFDDRHLTQIADIIAKAESQIKNASEVTKLELSSLMDFTTGSIGKETPDETA